MGAPEGAGEDDGQGEEGLTEGHDAQHECCLLHHPGVGVEQARQGRGQQEQGGGGADGHHKAQLCGQGAVGPGVLLLPGPHGLAHQGDAGVGDAVGGQIAQPLGGDGDLVGGQGHGAQGGHHGGGGDLPQVDGGPLHRGGQAQPHRLADDVPVGAQALPQVHPEAVALPGADAQQGDARRGQGRRRGDGRPRRPQPRAGNGDLCPEEHRRPGGIDEQEVEHDVQQVGRRVEVQRRPGVAHTAEDGGEDLPGGHEGHGHGVEPQVGHRLGQHLRLRPQPAGDEPGQGLVEQQPEEAHHDGGQHPLADHPPGLLVVPGPDGVGHLDRVAHPHPHQQAVGQPDGGRVHRHGGGARRPQHAHHGGVRIADHGGEHLLNDGGPGQPPQGFQPGLPGLACLHVSPSLIPPSDQRGECMPAPPTPAPG